MLIEGVKRFFKQKNQSISINYIKKISPNKIKYWREWKKNHNQMHCDS